MAKLEDKLIELIDKAEQVGVDIAPQALEKLTTAAFIEGVTNIIIGGVALVVVMVSSIIFYRALNVERRNFPRSPEWCLPVMIGTGVVGFIATITALVALLSSSNWLRVIDPLAYVTQRLLT